MKTLLLLACLFFLNLSAAAQVTVDWYNYPNGVAVATDNQNNVYTAYWDYNSGGDITLTKRNSSGAVLWNAPYNNTDNTRHEVATWVDVDYAGNIVVSGTIRSGYSNPVNAASVLMKFNAAGTLLWRVVYENSFDGSSTRKCLIDAANNIYVLGIGTGPNGQVTKVKKFDAAGNTVWNYFDTGVGAPVNFKFTPDNKILIVHRSITGNLNGYSKIDLNGNPIWIKGGVTSLGGGDAAGDAAGNTYMINSSAAGSVLTKLNPLGAVLWAQPNSFSGNKVEVGSDQQPVVGGYPINSFGVVMMKTDTAGTLLWQNLDADGPALGLLALTPMKMDAANAIYIAGSTMSQMGVCKVNSNGATVWAATTPTGYPASFVLGADNNVYVTGGTTARFLQSPPVVSCLPPTGLSVSNITPVSAKLNWTAVPNIIRYLVMYKQPTDSVWKRVYVSKTKTSVTINNLICGAAYRWKIRTVCDTIGVDLVSAFSPVKGFSTAACRLTDATAWDAGDVELYPNPAHDMFTLKFSALNEGDVMVDIVDLAGRSVSESIRFFAREGENLFQINSNNLLPGVYFCRINHGNNRIALRLVKE